MELLKLYIQEVSGLVLVLRYERAPRDMATSERDVTSVDLFIVHTLALSSLSLTQCQIKNGSIRVVANRITE